MRSAGRASAHRPTAAGMTRVERAARARRRRAFAHLERVRDQRQAGKKPPARRFHTLVLGLSFAGGMGWQLFFIAWMLTGHWGYYVDEVYSLYDLTFQVTGYVFIFAMTRFKAPRKVVFGSLPKTSTGKIQKFELRERARKL